MMLEIFFILFMRNRNEFLFSKIDKFRMGMMNFGRGQQSTVFGVYYCVSFCIIYTNGILSSTQ